MFAPGDKITWHKSRKWGGKEAHSATFVAYVSDTRAAIEVGGKRHIVAIKNIAQRTR